MLCLVITRHATDHIMSASFNPSRRHSLACLPLILALALFCFGAASSASASESASAVTPPEPMEFLVNIKKGEYGRGILRIAIVLEYADSRLAAHYLRFRPKLMHQILLVLSEQASEVLLSTKGKLDLKRQIVREINETFGDTGPSGIKDAFITDFFVQ